MSATLRQIAVNLFTTPKPVAPISVPVGRRRETWAVIIAAAVVGGWIFAFLMRRYFGLGTGGDMYVNVQLATSWLEGRFLQDRLFGNYLSVHTYFFSPLLAVFVYPFGAPGLLLATGLAAALGVVAMVKILRLFGLSTRLASAYAVITTLMPLSLQVYQIDETGFQVELLIPALALWLAYFLLKRQWMGSLMLGLALQAVKENLVLLLVPVTVTVVCEDFFRSFGSAPSRPWREKWNGPALTVGLVSVLVTPLLLYLVKSQPVQEYHTLNSFAKVHAVDLSPVTDLSSLWNYVTDNLLVWLSSATVVRWLAAVLAGTWGLVILRPHLLIVGVLTSLTAWLVQTNLLWAPRLAPVLAFIQLVGCLGFVSVCRLLRDQPRVVNNGVWRTGALVIGGALICGVGLYGQYLLAPRCGEVFRLAPTFEVEISPDELRQADELFGRYRRESRPDEPVTASPYLFRYIHDRNFFWATRLRGRPKPIWILWDKGHQPVSALWAILRANGAGDVDGYKLYGANGRFLLFKRKSAAEVSQEAQLPGPPIAGENYGMIRMKIKIAAGRAGLAEPLLSIGSRGDGDLFFFRYLDDSHLVLGMENMGEGVYTSEPIPFDTDTTYDLELFSGTLLAPGTSAQRLEFGNVVSARFAGREVLRSLAPHHLARPDQVFAGVNTVMAASAGPRFLGTISDVARGGYPTLANGPAADNRHGPLRLVLRLPGATAAVPEPLVVAGATGDAILGYVRVLPDSMIKVGAELWGIGVHESEPVAVKNRERVKIGFSFPSLFPPMGDRTWGDVPETTQTRLRTHLTISVDGTVVLDRNVSNYVPKSSNLAFGTNPAGGSVVGAAFTGDILQVTRASLERP